jgi:hypothetical protein
MTFENPPLVTILIWVMIGLLSVHAIGVIIACAHLRRKVILAEKKAERLAKEATTCLGALEGTLEKLKGLNQALPVLEKSVSSLLGRVSSAAVDANRVTDKGIGTALARIDAMDRRLELTLIQFMRQTTHVNQWIRYPAIHVSALIQGFLAAFRELSPRRQIQPTTHSSEDEDFI